ncbi:MAG TPA: CBS domain-containing protein [Rhizomicrobium sp.]|jgi:CBS domain-containing protein|nr:CBS domain-containing protein [Rhizomicrobium sp.]
MRIKNILKSKGGTVITIGAFESVSDAMDTMVEHKIAALVLTNGAKVIGVVSERDFLKAISDGGVSVLNAPVLHIITDRLVTVSPEDTTRRVMQLMTHSRIRHLPVMENGQLVGIVSVGDIVKYHLEELEMESNVLRDIAVAAR